MGKKSKKNAQFVQLNEEGVRTELSETSVRSSRKTETQEMYKKKKEEEAEKPKGPTWPVYKRFFAYTLKRWKTALLCVVLTILSGFANSIFPWQVGILLDLVTNQTINNVETEKFREKLVMHLWILAGITVGMGLMTFLRFVALQLFQEHLSIDLKAEIYSIFIRNDINFFEIYKTGELISRLNGDINQAKSAVSNNLTYLIRNLVTIITTIILLLVINWKLTFIVMTIVPVFAFVTLQYTRKAKILVKERQNIEAQIASHIGEKFSGIQIIKSFCSEQQEIDKYVRYNWNSYDVNRKRTIYQGIHMMFSQVLPTFGGLLVLLYIGVMILKGKPELSAGQLTAFILYCNNLANNTQGISNSYTNIVNGASAIQRVFEMMDYERLIDEESGRSVQIHGNIEFDQVKFKYPRAENLMFKGLSLEIKQGEYVAFVGQSGSGKSTITKLIEHFYQVNGGRILFDGQDSHDLNKRYLRQQIGLVNQDATIFSGTLEENITYGMHDYSLEDLEEAAKKSGCLEFINNKTLFPEGYHTILGEKGLNLSGGQRQRISIARALIRKPKILIFDEATSALDSHSEAMVQKSIEELASNHSMTIIIVAHRLSTVIQCDRLFVMKEGQIIETGSHRQLIKQNGYYYELIQKQLHKDAHQGQSHGKQQNMGDQQGARDEMKPRMSLERGRIQKDRPYSTSPNSQA